VPLPEVVVPPGVRTRVHVPDAGSPLRTTLPVDVAQFGCVMGPTKGGVGVAGWVLISTSDEDAETHPSALVTVNV